MAKKPNWDAIKAEYLRGGISIKKLAEKHGVSFDTLKKRANREAWGDARHQVGTEVAQELPQIVKGAILSEAERWVAETIRINQSLRTLLEKRFDGNKSQVVSSKEGPVPIEVPFLNGAQDFKAVADTLAQLDKVVRQALGLDAKVDKDATEEEKQASMIVVPADSEEWRGLIDGDDEEE